VKVIKVSKETTSTSNTTGGDKYKDTGLEEICRKDAHTMLVKYGHEQLTPQELLEVLISQGTQKRKQLKLPRIYG
jgi:hypothetical protein